MSAHRSIERMMLFSGNANPALAQQLAAHLGVPLGKILVDKFSDEESNIEIQENVRGRDIFVIQTLSTPGSFHLLELLFMIDAMYRAAAQRIIAVIPYLGFCRQDRRLRSARVPISAKVVADMIGAVPTRHILTMDLHSDQIQGFFRMPLDNIYASPVLIADIFKHFCTDNITVVSPDIGGVVRARAIAKQLNDADLAIIDKRRPQPNESQVMNIIGNVKGRTCIIVDDLVDTAGTLSHAAHALKEQGAERVCAYATHAVLSGRAAQIVAESALDELVVTDTIVLSQAASECSKIRQISVAELFAEAIRRIYLEESISSLFNS